MTLTAVGNSRVNGDLPGGIDAHACVFVRAKAARLDVAFDAQTDIASLRPRRLLLPPKTIPVDRFQQTFEGFRIIAAVEHHRVPIAIENAGLVRHLGWGNEVLAPEFDRIDADLLCGAIHDPI